MEQNIDRKALIRAAFAAREYAYTPYSNFKVGAALLAKNGGYAALFEVQSRYYQEGREF